MTNFIREGRQVVIRRPAAVDQDEFLVLMRQSQEFLAPWVYPPDTEDAFQRYLESRAKEQQDGFLLCHSDTHAIMGVINVNEIVRGAFQSAYLGYYIGAPYAGKGYMKEALTWVIQYAFSELELHRLEANIQPENHASIALVTSCGFTQEGFSPRYLNIGGEWRDHERWAILADEAA